ncbi:uncharacterized protein LOC105174906 isoform X1 [Sesamum indicum]|uniref:Uncharacterized protein LOC105174906 isoform X1 n=1 Tax=Sesamum indicum TaxID=4182 RepID=A0A6I9UC05_SESIN|nr:uncharacterized protein LOC105174906 isoform X1 [Sesamum indicum]
MEGVGSRQSRASSRYAPSPSAPVFNGPVRKWKKQWVSSQSNNQNNGNNRNDAPPLLLCRWTPLPATATADEPRKRRFRYAPIVPIERGNVEALEKVSNEARTSIRNQSENGANMTTDVDGMLEKPRIGDVSAEDTQSITLQEMSEDQEDSNKSPVNAPISKSKA